MKNKYCKAACIPSLLDLLLTLLSVDDTLTIVGVGDTNC